MSYKKRQHGRMLDDLTLRAMNPRYLGARWDGLLGRTARGCPICKKSHTYVHVNGHDFCYVHSPGQARYWLKSYSNGHGFTAGAYPNKRAPSRKTCERILRLAGEPVPGRKRSKPPKQRRGRRFRNS